MQHGETTRAQLFSGGQNSLLKANRKEQQLLTHDKVIHSDVDAFLSIMAFLNVHSQLPMNWLSSDYLRTSTQSHKHHQFNPLLMSNPYTGCLACIILHWGKSDMDQNLSSLCTFAHFFLSVQPCYVWHFKSRPKSESCLPMQESFIL